MVSDSGIELLIHIGINTVKLKGQHFKPVVRENDQITIGNKLVEFDLKQIVAAGYDPTVMIVVTNSFNYDQVQVNFENPNSNQLLLLTSEEAKG
ncbi:MULTISPECIES: PTS sugar transporter subunit IIA [unclassified Paenibacillus]|uniref:PTS sugar transporter subunit IIA n=1 Tax=unclassified Paenibacillus TaxID=185978 RepID=UPI0030F93FF4